jgi:hypothetical protein
MDSLEQYNDNVKNKHEYLVSNGWLDTDIEYRINSDGFRCEELLTSKSIMSFGCSYTLGVGLPENYTWPFLVAKYANLANYNLGIAGGSNDTAFRLSQYYIPLIKPEIVLFLSAPEYRLELIKDDNEVRLMHPARSKWSTDPAYQPFYQDWISGETNAVMNLRKNVLAVENMCNQFNIKFIHVHYTEFKRLDFARDLAHYGIRSNKEMADNFTKKLFEEWQY